MQEMQRRPDVVRNLKIAISISLPIIVFDYITKWLTEAHLSISEHIRILPFLQIVHVQNEGAAFGMFAHFGNRLFMAISIIAIIIIILYLIRIPRGLELYSMSMILGGAMGNLLDRIRIGKVTDFIDFFIKDWHWPAFNVADSALTIGIILFLIANIGTHHHR